MVHWHNILSKAYNQFNFKVSFLFSALEIFQPEPKAKYKYYPIAMNIWLMRITRNSRIEIIDQFGVSIPPPSTSYLVFAIQRYTLTWSTASNTKVVSAISLQLMHIARSTRKESINTFWCPLSLPLCLLSWGCNLEVHSNLTYLSLSGWSCFFITWFTECNVKFSLRQNRMFLFVSAYCPPTNMKKRSATPGRNM
jgi:hypothetical protein